MRRFRHANRVQPLDPNKEYHNLLKHPVFVRLLAAAFVVVTVAGSFSFSFSTGLTRSLISDSSLLGEGAMMRFQNQNGTAGWVKAATLLASYVDFYARAGVPSAMRLSSQMDDKSVEDFGGLI